MKSMSAKRNSKRCGFTVVELLIVIVVIAILAALMVVGYGGMQERARKSVAQNFISNTRKQLGATYIKYGTYPATLEANPDDPIVASGGLTVNYYPNNSSSPPTYVLNVTTGNTTYYADSASSDNGQATSYFTEYLYGNTTLSGTAAATNQVTSVNYNWGTGGPAGVGTDNFSGRWEGAVVVPSTGSYTFAVSSDDGQRLYLNGTLVIDDWVLHGTTTRTYTTSLTQGQLLSIRYEFFEQGGGAVARLEWDRPSMARAPITTQ